MSFKDEWVPQNETMPASADIPNMLANAIIENENVLQKVPEKIDNAIQSAIYDSWEESTDPYDTLGVSE